jgi:hypothetical protein
MSVVGSYFAIFVAISMVHILAGVCLPQPAILGFIRLHPLDLAHSVRLDGTADAAATLVVVLAVLVADLAAALAASVLAALLEAGVEVGADDALVELGAAYVLHAVEGVLVGEVLDEAEAAGRLGESVEAHDQSLDLAYFGEELVDLLFGCVEGPGRRNLLEDYWHNGAGLNVGAKPGS